MIRGLDASAVQGAIPFNGLDEECKFIILKGQQGNDGFDPWLVRNAKAAIGRGIEVFAYAFAYPLPNASGKIDRDPIGQARLFVDRTLSACPELAGRPLFLDYEWPEIGDWGKWGCNPKQLSAWMQENAAEVERLSGRTPAIYTYDYWWKGVSVGADVSWAAKYDLWMAWYVKAWPKPGDKPRIPAPWTNWKFWQWDGNGGYKLPNGTDSDACVFNGTVEELRAWARGSLPERPAHDSVLGRAAIDTLE